MLTTLGLTRVTSAAMSFGPAVAGGAAAGDGVSAAVTVVCLELEPCVWQPATTIAIATPASIILERDSFSIVRLDEAFRMPRAAS
jgi:hypothetical protein